MCRIQHDNSGGFREKLGFFLRVEPLALFGASVLPYDPFSVDSTALARDGTGVSTNSLDSFVQRGAQFGAEAINLGGIFGRKQLTKQGLNGIFQQYAPRTGTVACQTMQRTTVKCVGNPDGARYKAHPIVENERRQLVGPIIMNWVVDASTRPQGRRSIRGCTVIVMRGSM